MEFGWISLFSASVVLLLLLPNVLFIKKINKAPKKTMPLALNACEQVGRYACMVLMWLPLFVWRLGFESAEELIIYFAANGALLLSYYVLWALYLLRKTLARAMALAVIPTVIFLLSGILLRHWALVIFAVLFGVSHCKITYLEHK